MEGVQVRLGKVEDAEVIAYHRCEMFKEMGELSDDSYEQLKASSIQYFQQAITDGRYIAWLATRGEDIIAGGGMQINMVPPRPGPNRNVLRPGPQGLIVNVYVEKEWRRKGIAELLIRRMINFARNGGIPSLVLHASEDGRSLYERLGFEPTAEMRLFM